MTTEDQPVAETIDEPATETAVEPAPTEPEAGEAGDGTGNAEAAGIAETSPAAQPATGSGDRSNAAAEVRGTVETPVDIDAEFNAADLLTDRYAAGLIDEADYRKQYAVHQKNITKAQRSLAEPAKQLQQTIQQQEYAKNYWNSWGKGQDVAQIQFAKTVGAARAKALWDQTQQEIAANPRYQRKEYNAERLQTILEDKWQDALAVEAKKKPGNSTSAPSAPATRHSGASGANNQASNQPPKTAREKLDAGEYGNLADAMKNLGS